MGDAWGFDRIDISGLWSVWSVNLFPKSLMLKCCVAYTTANNSFSVCLYFCSVSVSVRLAYVMISVLSPCSCDRIARSPVGPASTWRWVFSSYRNKPVCEHLIKSLFFAWKQLHEHRIVFILHLCAIVVWLRAIVVLDMSGRNLPM